MGGFLAELRRRQVLRVLGFYAITVWVVVQVAADTFTPLGIPQGVHTALVIALMLGFPVVAVLSWVFDITPQGIVRTAPAEHEVRLNEFGEAISERPRLWIDALIITVLLGMIAYLLIPTPTGGERNEPAASVAVLPFLNLSTDPDDAFLGDALAEDIIHQLAQISGLRVAARTSSWAWRDRRSEIPRIAEALRVDSVLEGTVQRESGRIKVTLQLIKGSDGYHLWSRTFDSAMGDVFRVKAEIARLTADSLGIDISRDTATRIARPSTTDTEAYELYLRGLEYYQRPHSDDVRDIAIKQFRGALDRDPRFAAAHAALCDALLYRYDDHRDQSDFVSAERACHRALTLEPTLAEAHLALGRLYRHAGQYDIAEDHVRTSIRERPSSDATLELAWILAETGREDEALAEFERAVSSDPGYWLVHYQTGLYHYRNDRYEKAADRFEWVVELTPDASHGFNLLAGAQFMSGDLEAATENLEKALAIEESRSVLTRAGLFRWYLGQVERAAEAFQRALEIAPDDFRNWCRLAMVQKRIPGIEDEVATAYRRGLELGSSEVAINPNNPDVHARLAHCYAGAGLEDQARHHLEKALTLAPDSAVVHYFAAVTHFALDDVERGIESTRRALDLGYSEVIVQRDPGLEKYRDRSSIDDLASRSAMDSDQH